MTLPLDPVSLTAGRLHLRPWEPWDAAEVHAACQDREVARWTTVPSPYTREDARVFVTERSPRGWADGTAASFAVLDATTAQVHASVALMGIADGSAEVGYWTSPGSRRQSHTAEAVGAVCRWGFGALGLERVLWRAEVGNWGSRAVAERCGFTVEGTLRLAGVDGGRRHDEWSGSLLATDGATDRRAFAGFQDLTGEGLVLRRWHDDDADRAALTAGAGDPETARWVPVGMPFTTESARWTLAEQYPLRWAEGSVADLAVEQDGVVVGYACLMLSGPRHAPEVGWWTTPAARGRGVATRAARVVSDWALARGADRVEAHVDPDNPASLRAAERAGFVREGLRRSAYRDRAGRPRDLVLLARTARAGAT